MIASDLSPRKLRLGNLLFCFLAVVGGVASALDVVVEPKRTFGLGDVRSLAVSHDHRFLATAGQTGAFLWDLNSGQLLMPLESPWSVTALAFSPDGRSFVSVAGEGIARVWASETGRQTFAVEKRDSFFFAAALSPDGNVLATLEPSRTNSVTLWNVVEQAELRSLPTTNWTPDRVMFTPDGQLVTAASGGEILLWDIEAPQVIRSFGGIAAPTFLVIDLWMPDSSTLAALGNDGRVFLWDFSSGELKQVVPGTPVVAGAGVPSALLAVLAGDDSIPQLRELPSGKTLQSYPGHTTSTHTAVAFSPTGRYVLSGGTEPGTRLWNRRTGQPIREFISSGSGSMSATFSPNGSNVLTTVGLPAPGALLWDVETGVLVREFRWSGSYPMSAAFSTDSSLVAAGAQDDRVRIFHTASGRLVRTLVGLGWMRSVAFSSTAPLLACGSTDSNARVYDVETGQLLHTFFANAGQVITVAFSPHGETLLVAWSDGLVRLFSTSAFELRREFVTQAAFLESAAFSPDGQYILTGEGWPAFTATLWDAASVQPLRVYAGHRAAVSAVAFSPDGGSILTAGERVREWSVADLAARLRFHRDRNRVQITWSLGQLQLAPTPTGPWQAIPGAFSPFDIVTEDPAGFYRVTVDHDP
jgi:WD40 repeat protein